MTNKLGQLSRKSSTYSEMDRIGGAQMHGILMKKPVGHKSTVWSKRFFVLKEGFLLYYGEQERKIFAEKSTFNIHPKGIIPLGCCTVDEISIPGVNYGIIVNNIDGTCLISLGAEDEHSRNRWIEAMEMASKVTLENCDLGDSMIRSLQEQTLQLAREKQEYYHKFMKEVEEVGLEREQREIVEQFNIQLEEEKSRIENFVSELQYEQDKIRKELRATTEACLTLEKDREILTEATQQLQKSLLDLSDERDAITNRLLNNEVMEDGDETEALREELEKISNSVENLAKEKLEMEKRLVENEAKLTQFSNEKKSFSVSVDDLKQEIQDLNKEKQNVETELKEEISARVELQQQLKECKEALRRLTMELQCPPEYQTSNGFDSKEKQEQINADVKSLKRFFDNVAIEGQIEPKKVDLSKRKFSRRFTQIKKLRQSSTSRKCLKIEDLGKSDGVSRTNRLSLQSKTRRSKNTRSVTFQE